MILTAFIHVVRRDVLHMVKQKLRLASTLLRPLMWLFIIGSGVAAMRPAIEGYPYQTYQIPGLVGMIILFNGIICPFAMVRERESGVFKLLLLAPFSYGWIILMRITSAILLSLFYAFIFLLLIKPFSVYPTHVHYSWLVLSLISVAFLWSAVGMLLAMLARSMEHFSLIINFVIFPVYFLSNALYPIERLPHLMQVMVKMNPFYYGVDALQSACGLSALSHHSFQYNITVNLLLGIFAMLMANHLLIKNNLE